MNRVRHKDPRKSCIFAEKNLVNYALLIAVNDKRTHFSRRRLYADSYTV